MANTNVSPGKMVDFAGGAGNTLTFTVNPVVRGLQINCEGCNLDDATIQTLAYGATNPETMDTTSVADKTSAEISSPNNLIRIEKIIVGGLAAGSYKFGVYQ